MENLKKLAETLTAKVLQLEAAFGKVEELEAKAAADDAGDEVAQELEAAQAVYDELSKETDTYEAKVAEAKKLQAKHVMRDELARLAEPEPVTSKVGKDGFAGAMVPAEAVNEVTCGKAHHEAFFKWIRDDADETLSGQERELLKAKTELRQGQKRPKDAVRVPDSLLCGMLGRGYSDAFGKGLLSKVVSTINNAVTNPSLANLLVPQEYIAQLQQLPFDEPTLLSRVTVVPTTTGVLTFPLLAQTNANEFGGVSFSWTQEAATKPETEPEFSSQDIETYELCGYTEISERAISRSAISLEALLRVLFRSAILFQLDNAVTVGTGVAQPTGIVNTAGINIVNRQAAGTVTDNDLVNLKHAVKPAHRGGAMFTIADEVEQALELTKDTLGRPLFRASTAGGAYDRLVGYMYAVSQNCPAIGTAGDVIYGNPKWYIMAMEEEVTVAKSEHFRFRTNRIAFKVFMVVGGILMQPRAMAILGDVES